MKRPRSLACTALRGSLAETVATGRQTQARREVRVARAQQLASRRRAGLSFSYPLEISLTIYQKFARFCRPEAK